MGEAVDTRLKKILMAPPVRQSAALDAAVSFLEVDSSLLVSQANAARLLGVSRHTIRRWVKHGLLVPVQIPGRPRFNLQQLCDFAQKGGERHG